MRQTKPKTTIFLAIALVCCLAAATALLLCKSRRAAPAFVEFSPGDSLKGGVDCCVNELIVWDRYAVGNERQPSQLLLVSYADCEDRIVVLSLLVTADDPIYARILPYASADEAPETPLALSGYFFSAPLKREGSDAVQAFDSETDEFTAWVQQRTGQSALVQPVVLRYAGGTEADYLAAVRARTAWMTAAAIVLFCGAAACGVGLLIKWKRGAAGSLAFARRFRYNTGKNGKG